MFRFTSLFLLLLTNIFLLVSVQRANSQTFEVDYYNWVLLKDGEPFNFVAGEMHYFRIPRLFWRDRLLKLKAAGCNAVSTYVEWSSHEPEEENYNFSGDLDLTRFLSLAQEVGLLVIFRPGPYICAERDFGGLPGWLLYYQMPEMQFRTSDPAFLYHVEKWYGKLFPLIQPFLYGKGGNIIMVQIENEYGSYPVNDGAYMLWLRDLFNKYIEDNAVLFTADGYTRGLISRGRIPGVLATINYGPNNVSVEDRFAPLVDLQPGGPFINSELYTGWFSYWGRPHIVTDTDQLVRTIKDLLENEVSFSMYMFHGGTNFGFRAGSNVEGYYLADTTSYDYDAPISEAGDLTPKYMAIRDTILNFYGTPSNLTIPRYREKGNYGNVQLQPICSLFSCPIGIDYQPRNDSIIFEIFNQSYGYVSYSIQLEVPSRDPSVLDAPIRDRAIVYLNDVEVGLLQNYAITRIPLPSSYEAGQYLRIFVENMGRRNYGLFFDCASGIVGNVTVDDQVLSYSNWTIKGYPFSTEDIKVLNELEPTDYFIYPAVFRGEFVVPRGKQPLDTYILMEGWGKGIVFINGFHIGRYWKIGAQKTLYVPRSCLKKHPHKNRVAVLELHKTDPSVSVTFVTEHQYTSYETKTFS